MAFVNVSGYASYFYCNIKYSQGKNDMGYLQLILIKIIFLIP